MQITTSYGVDIKTHKYDLYCKETMRIFRCAVSWLLAPVQKYWNDMQDFPYENDRMKYIEQHTHKTKKHSAPEYDFDSAFPNMPCYFRRSAVMNALGAYSSYVSNHNAWINNGKHGSEPKLGVSRNACPVFYRGNMYEQDMNTDTAGIKLFDGKNWIWCDILLKHTDMEYLRKHWNAKEKVSAPALEKHYGTYRLRFACSVNQKLTDVPLEKQKICAVDLGINTDAVCSVMKPDGTILARKFINFASDKGRLYHALNRLKQFQHRHGSHDVGNLWRYVRALNDQLAYRIGNAIAEYAVRNGCDVIVFEHLDTSGHKIRGSKRQKLAMWKKNTVQAICTTIAHKHGVRISRICAWGTSKMAYDGSGVTARSVNGNYSICQFQNGKVYNCDLSASYNIGARYIIRAIQKSMNESSWSRITAEVPDAVKRTRCTMSTLWQINDVLSQSALV